MSGTLKRGLTARHIQFIALGGAIGAGLFLGSGVAIKAAGPSVLIAYAAAGVVIFLMARAMGEMALGRPAASSFITIVEEMLGTRIGFIIGWSYWLIWVLVGIAELTAMGVFLHFWFPTVPQWLTGLVVLAVLYAINRITVELFGEIEFWLSLVKVIAIIGLIFAAAALVISGAGGAGVDNLWRWGGFLPNGSVALVAALPAALFAFGGTELVGVTVAESEAPEQTLPRAINGLIARILTFYIASLALIMMVVPWSHLSGTESPFVAVMDRAGFVFAASVINLVALTATISSCNSGIYATGRVLLSLAEKHQAPAWLGDVNGRGLPHNAISASALAMLAGVAGNWLFPSAVFGFVAGAVAALLVWTWAAILAAHLRFRRARGGVPIFPMPLYPYGNYAALLFLALILVLLAFNAETRTIIYAMLAWAAIIGPAAFVVTRTPPANNG